MNVLKNSSGEKDNDPSGWKKLFFFFTLAFIVAEIFFLLYKITTENTDQGSRVGELENVEQDQNSILKPLNPRIQAINDAVEAAFHIKFSEEEKSITFTDSMVSLYEKGGQLDSSVQLAEQAALFFDSQENLRKAGNYFYDAYSTASNSDERKKLGEKARFFFEKILLSDPQNADIKIKIAMTYLDSATPSQGTQMLNEVVEKNPNNKEALFTLGMISEQSGEHKKAAIQLKKVVSIDPNHLQAQMLLGVALLHIGQKEEAQLQFEKIKQISSDTVVHALVDSYLEDLK